MPSGLVFVAQAGKLNEVKRLLSCGDVHEKDEHGACALHQATREGHVDVMKCLIATGADVNSRGELGRTPLMYAVENRTTCEPLRVLLSAGVRMHDADEGLEASALALAAQLGTPEAVELLLGQGADVLQADRLGMLPVHRAAQHGVVETLATLLDHCASSLDPQSITIREINEKDGTPSQNKDVGGVPDENGTNGTNGTNETDGTNGTNGMPQQENNMVNAAATSNNATPLHCATSGGKIHNVLLLLNRGAKINTRMNDGSTPLHVACGAGNCPVAEVLLDNGADVNSQKHGGFTPLGTACAVGDLSMSTLLLENGADANMSGDNGWAPLHYAAMRGDVELVRLLLPQCNPAATTNQGETALYLAAHYNNPDLVPLLLDHCDVNQATTEGNTALHSAAEVGNSALVQQLVRQGARVDVCNGQGRTPLDVAKMHGHGTSLGAQLKSKVQKSTGTFNGQEMQKAEDRAPGQPAVREDTPTNSGQDQPIDQGEDRASNQEKDQETIQGQDQATNQEKDEPTIPGQDQPYQETDQVLCTEDKPSRNYIDDVPDVKDMSSLLDTRL